MKINNAPNLRVLICEKLLVEFNRKEKPMKQNKTEIQIKVKEFNAKEIEDEIELIQKTTQKRELGYSDLYSATELAESMLDNILDKLNRQNIIATVRPVSSAYSINYRGDPEETICKIKRKKDGWYLINVQRVKASRKGSFRVEIDQRSIVEKTEKIIKYLSSNLKC
jgi:hypothetical protein